MMGNEAQSCLCKWEHDVKFSTCQPLPTTVRAVSITLDHSGRRSYCQTEPPEFRQEHCFARALVLPLGRVVKCSGRGKDHKEPMSQKLRSSTPRATGHLFLWHRRAAEFHTRKPTPQHLQGVDRVLRPGHIGPQRRMSTHSCQHKPFCLLLVAFLLLVVRPGAPSSSLAPSRNVLCP